MFEDEAFEPNLDVYREINHDLNTGQHRKNLIAATSSTLGKDVVKSKSNVSIFDFEQHGRRLVIYLARKGVPMNVIIGICALTPFVAFIIFRFLWEQYLVLDRKLDLLYYKRKYGPDFRLSVSKKPKERKKPEPENPNKDDESDDDEDGESESDESPADVSDDDNDTGDE